MQLPQAPPAPHLSPAGSQICLWRAHLEGKRSLNTDRTWCHCGQIKAIPSPTPARLYFTRLFLCGTFYL